MKCTCSWGGPDSRCSAGGMLFKKAKELHLCITGAEFLRRSMEERDSLWDEYEKNRNRFAKHMEENSSYAG